MDVFVDEELGKDNYDFAILTFHIPPVATCASYYSDNEDDFAAIVQKYTSKIRAIVVGHNHCIDQRTYNGVPMITLEALVDCAFDPNDPATCHDVYRTWYAIYDAEKDSFEFKGV